MDIEQIYSLLGAITNISYVPIFLLMVFSGVYKQYRAFTCYIALMGIWGYADYMMGLTDDYLPLWRLYNFCNILNGFLFYIFSNEITKKYNKKSIILSGVLCVFFLFINYYDNILMPDAFMELTGFELMREIVWYNLFVVYYCTLLILGTLHIYKYYHAGKTIRNLILFACCSTIIGDTYSYGTVYFESLYNFPYIAYIICFLPYSITYLVLKHRLFDARSMLLQMLRWLFIGTVGIMAGFGLYLALLQYGFISHFEIALLIVDLIPIIIILLLARSHRIRSIFSLSDLVQLEDDIYNFTASSAVYKSTAELIEDIMTSLRGGLKITGIQLVGKTDIIQYPHIQKALDYDGKKIKILSYKEAKIDTENGQKIPYISELEKLGEMCIPIYIEKKLSYIFILPEKGSQAPYTKQEKKIITTLRPKIALSLQILEYNQTLREEVDNQTLQINEQKIKLEESYKKLEALDHEKDVFMNMAAHELRTPMTIIRGYADILLDGGSGAINEGQKKLVENMFKSSESLIALVNDLLDLSRIDAGKMELKYEKCDIGELVQNTFENFQTLMTKKNMNFVLEENLNKDVEFITDKSKLTLLFNNLISNAYKYTPEKGKVVWKLDTITKDANTWITISVTDSGVGIPETELPHVFDRFASISTHNNIASVIQSTGLGLSIVKKIVKRMGGKIDVISTVGKGSKFTIELPYKPNTNSEENK